MGASPNPSRTQLGIGTYSAQVGELGLGSCASTRDQDPEKNKKELKQHEQKTKIVAGSQQRSSHIPVSLAGEEKDLGAWEKAITAFAVVPQEQDKRAPSFSRGITRTGALDDVTASPK